MKDIANELRFAAEDIRINKLSVEEAENRYSHMIKFVDYLEQTEPELKVNTEIKVQEMVRRRFLKTHGIQ